MIHHQPPVLLSFVLLVPLVCGQTTDPGVSTTPALSFDDLEDLSEELDSRLEDLMPQLLPQLPLGPASTQASRQGIAPPPLLDGLAIVQGGATVAVAPPGSLVIVDGRTGAAGQRKVDPETLAATVADVASVGGIIVIIPPDAPVISARLLLDASPSICRGSFCPGSGSGPVVEERTISLLTASNSSASHVYPADARLPIAVHPI